MKKLFAGSLIATLFGRLNRLRRGTAVQPAGQGDPRGPTLGHRQTAQSTRAREGDPRPWIRWTIVV